MHGEHLTLGPLMVDVAGYALTEPEKTRLSHPLVGGVILFRRNFESVAQLMALIAEIRQLRTPHLLIAVDHEGGRVQRFRQGFTRLPPMQRLGELWASAPQKAKTMADKVGYVLAAELRACGVDFSFAPVLDLNYGTSAVIGDRAFSGDAHVVTELAGSLMHGLRRAGMSACGKHFPGHGYVKADSHLEIPVDERSWEQLQNDLLPFRRMVQAGIAALMPAHVIYPAVDARPAGFSTRWLQQVLRQQLQFDGALFSDDLGMEGAGALGGDVCSRAEAAITAGCDMVLICNKPGWADLALQKLSARLSAQGLARLARMHGQPHPKTWAELAVCAEYQAAVRDVETINHESGDLFAPAVGEAPAPEDVKRS